MERLEIIDMINGQPLIRHVMQAYTLYSILDERKTDGENSENKNGNIKTHLIQLDIIEIKILPVLWTIFSRSRQILFEHNASRSQCYFWTLGRP